MERWTIEESAIVELYLKDRSSITASQRACKECCQFIMLHQDMLLNDTCPDSMKMALWQMNNGLVDHICSEKHGTSWEKVH